MSRVIIEFIRRSDVSIAVNVTKSGATAAEIAKDVDRYGPQLRYYQITDLCDGYWKRNAPAQEQSSRSLHENMLPA